MSTIQPITIAQALTLNLINWEYRNVEAERFLNENEWGIRVQHKTVPEKNFTVSVFFNEPGIVTLRLTKGDPLKFEHDLDGGKFPIMKLLSKLPVSGSVLRKYQESLSLVGEPKDQTHFHPTSNLEPTTNVRKAFLGFFALSKEDDVTVSGFDYEVAGLTSGKGHPETKIHLLAIRDENDNPFSGRYCLYEQSLNGEVEGVVEIEVDAESMIPTIGHVDVAYYENIYNQVNKVKGNDLPVGDGNFNRVIANEDKVAIPLDCLEELMFPVASPMTLENVLEVAIHVCNTELGLHTVANRLDFTELGARLSIASKTGGWLNLFIGLKDGLIYINRVTQPVQLNFSHTLSITGMENIATLGATWNNSGLIRKEVREFAMAARVEIPLVQPAASMAMSSNQRRREEDYSWMKQEPVMDFGSRRVGDLRRGIPASAFTEHASPLFAGLGTSDRQERLLKLDELLATLSLGRLTHEDADKLTANAGWFFTEKSLNLSMVASVIKICRPGFNVIGSLSTESL